MVSIKFNNWFIITFSIILFSLISINLAQAGFLGKAVYQDGYSRPYAYVRVYHPVEGFKGLCGTTNESGYCQKDDMTLLPNTLYKANATYPDGVTLFAYNNFITDSSGYGIVTMTSNSNCPSSQQCCVLNGPDILCNGRNPYTTSGLGIMTNNLCYTNCSYYKCDVNRCGVNLSFYDPRYPYIPPANMRCVYNCRTGPCSGGCAYGGYADSWAWIWNDTSSANCEPNDFCCNDNGCAGVYKCNTGTYRCRTSCSSDSDCKPGYTCVSPNCVFVTTTTTTTSTTTTTTIPPTTTTTRTTTTTTSTTTTTTRITTTTTTSPSCTGPISLLSFSPNPAWAGNYQVKANVSGLSNCNGKRVLVRLNQSGYTIGWTSCQCTVGSSGSDCSCNVIAPAFVSTQNPVSTQDFNFKAYVDVNNNYKYFDPVDLTTTGILTVNCVGPGLSCGYSINTCCRNFFCSDWDGTSHGSFKCRPSGGGGCPTLFVYDGKEYVKERKSSIHSQPGIDTVDDIILTTKPVVVNGNYLLQLKETTLPEHSYIDAVRLFVTDSEGKKEAELVSAKHSKYGDVTSLLTSSDDKRTDTQVFDNIELKFAVPKLKGEAKDFTFEIEGYNPAVNILGRGVSILGQVGRYGFYKLDLADFNIHNLPIIFVCIVISILSIVIIFNVFKMTMRSDNT